MEAKIGQWSFIGGILIAIVIGIFSSTLGGDLKGWLILLLVVLGLIVGFLNISEKETTPFLVASVALLITSTAGDTLQLIPTVGVYLVGVVQQIGVFVTPAAIVVAIKAINSLAQN